jgi:hypothetical protein
MLQWGVGERQVVSLFFSCAFKHGASPMSCSIFGEGLSIE